MVFDCVVANISIADTWVLPLIGMEGDMGFFRMFRLLRLLRIAGVMGDQLHRISFGVWLDSRQTD